MMKYVATSESPDTAEYFACVLQSADRLTDLRDKKTLLKDKVHVLLLLIVMKLITQIVLKLL